MAAASATLLERRLCAAIPGATVPDSTFIAWGIYGQQVIVVPEARIVIARVGNDPDGWDGGRLVTLVLEAVTGP